MGRLKTNCKRIHRRKKKWACEASLRVLMIIITVGALVQQYFVICKCMNIYFISIFYDKIKQENKNHSKSSILIFCCEIDTSKCCEWNCNVLKGNGKTHFSLQHQAKFQLIFAYFLTAAVQSKQFHIDIFAKTLNYSIFQFFSYKNRILSFNCTVNHFLPKYMFRL